MRFDPQAGISQPDLSEKNTRRRSGRLPLETLQCNLGPIVDLSAGGMCVLTRHVPGKPVRIAFNGYQQPEPLLAVVTWSKRVGLFKHEVGFRFENVSPEMAGWLTKVAGVHRFRRVM